MQAQESSQLDMSPLVLSPAPNPGPWCPHKPPLPPQTSVSLGERLIPFSQSAWKKYRKWPAQRQRDGRGDLRRTLLERDT